MDAAADGGIVCYPDNPSKFVVDGVGWVDYLEFEETIWVWDVFSVSRGKGVKLAILFIEHARKLNKDIYGQANPQEHTHGMTTERLERWYYYLGARPINIIDDTTAMKLEIRKWRK